MTLKTGERLMKVETEMKAVKEVLNDHIKQQKNDFRLIFEKLDGMTKSMADSYAGKWVEKEVRTNSIKLAKWAGGIVVVIGIIQIMIQKWL